MLRRAELVSGIALILLGACIAFGPAYKIGATPAVSETSALLGGCSTQATVKSNVCGSCGKDNYALIDGNTGKPKAATKCADDPNCTEPQELGASCGSGSGSSSGP